MAELDPDYKDVAVPEARGWSRPISDIQGDKSKGSLLSGLGGAFKEGVEGAVNLVKSDISDQIQTGVTEQRNALNTELRWTKNTLEGGVSKGQDQGTLYQRADLQGQSVPNGVRAAINNANTLSSARDNGHISETYYWGRLDNLASDIRSKYPGFRDYVDAQFEKVSGKNPANALMASLIGDINASVAARKEEKDKLPNAIFELVKEGDPGAYKVYDGLRKGTTSYDSAAEYLAKTKASKWNYEQTKLGVDTKNLAQGEIAKQTEDNITGRAADVTAHAVDAHMVGDGFKEGDNLTKGVNSLREGKVDPLQKERVLAELDQTLNNTEASLRAEFTKSGRNGKSDVQNLGPGGYAKMNEIIKQSTESLRTLREDIVNDKYGSLHADSRMIAAYGTQSGRALMEDPTIGTRMRMSKGFEQVAGPNWYQTWLQRVFIPDVKPNVVAAVQERMEKMLNPTPQNVTNPTTFKGTVEDLKARGIKAPEAYSKILDQVDVITDTTAKPEVRLQAVRAFFDQQNQGVLKLFSKDTFVDGKFLPGQESMFGKMTSPDVTKSIRELSTRDSSVWDKYANWSKTEYGSLFRSQLSDLRDFPAEKYGIRIGVVPGEKGIKLFADSNIDYNRNDPSLVADTQGRVRQLNNTILSRVNAGLNNIGEIAKAEGSDVSEYMIRQLQENGIDPRKLNGIPEQMMRAISAPAQEESSKQIKRKKDYGK